MNDRQCIYFSGHVTKECEEELLGRISDVGKNKPLCNVKEQNCDRKLKIPFPAFCLL